MGASREGYWSAFDLLPCLDGKTRRIESGSFPLAHGIPGRVGLLRGYGNAIVPQVAAEFVMAFLECGENHP
jgi:DNA (cytosine-5)-methyltransferase 1